MSSISEFWIRFENKIEDSWMFPELDKEGFVPKKNPPKAPHPEPLCISIETPLRHGSDPARSGGIPEVAQQRVGRRVERVVWKVRDAVVGCAMVC